MLPVVVDALNQIFVLPILHRQLIKIIIGISTCCYICVGYDDDYLEKYHSPPHLKFCHTRQVILFVNHCSNTGKTFICVQLLNPSK